MPERNFEMKTICTICSTPFDGKEEGYVGEINKIPAKLCSNCYNGFEEVVDASIPHTTIECPQCNHEIGIRLDVLNES